MPLMINAFRIEDEENKTQRKKDVHHPGIQNKPKSLRCILAMKTISHTGINYGLQMEKLYIENMNDMPEFISPNC